MLIGLQNCVRRGHTHIKHVPPRWHPCDPQHTTVVSTSTLEIHNKMEWNNDSVAGLGSGSGSDVVIVSPIYCAPHTVHLIFSKKAPGVKSGHLAVVDAYGRVMYRVEGHHWWTVRDRMLLLDANDQPVLLVQSQRKSSHAAYDVYRGDSRDAKDLLFSISRAAKDEVHVCLSSNREKHSVDFKISGNVEKRTIRVYKGESAQMAAEMSQEQISTSVPADKMTFVVAVSPNVDSCFIAALFAVLPQIYGSSAKSASEASKESGSQEDSENSGPEKDSEQKASKDSEASVTSRSLLAAGVMGNGYIVPSST